MNSEQFRRRITEEINRQAALWAYGQPGSIPRTNVMNAGKGRARAAAARRIEKLCPDSATGQDHPKGLVTSAHFHRLASTAVSRTAADIMRQRTGQEGIPPGELSLEKARAFQEARHRVLAAVRDTDG